MRRYLLTASGLIVAANGVLAQSPSFFPQQPVAPSALLPIRPQPAPLIGEPRPLPPAITGRPAQFPTPFPVSPQQPAAPQQSASDSNQPQVNTEITLPQKENLARLDGGSLTVRRMTNSWQIWAGTTVFRDFGGKGEDAAEAVRVMRELRPTDWTSIGSERPIVEYGLTNGKAFLPAFPPKLSLPIDIAGVRAEQVRGVWVLRDDANILLNFGTHRRDAEQAAAVCKRYGFNRLGSIGSPAPLMSFFFAQSGRTTPAATGPQAAQLMTLANYAQEQNLQKTGIDVPGVGFMGERLVIDPRKLEIRKDKSNEWVVASGPDTIAKFGASEWSARDGLKLLQDMRVTEFCRVNADVSFFLVHGAPPARVPFAVQSYRFEVDTLRVKTADAGSVAVYEGNGRKLFNVANTEEGEHLIRLLKHYKFDQTCQLGLSSKTALKFLAKAGR